MIAYGKLLLLNLIFLAVIVAQPQEPAATNVTLGLETVVPAGTFTRPVDIANAGDGRLFIVEQVGTIRIIMPDGSVPAIPFLDIGARVESGGNEQGLLGLVFHPDYVNNGYFYVNYTAEPDGDTHISRFEVTGDPNVADAASETILLTVDQPYANHNAGDLAFGPDDGYLYVPLGDGGSSNDPGNRAQNGGLLLGKILRLDVDGKDGNLAADCGAPGNYLVPADNPLLDGAGGACDEIWALGLRNPWRFSFDRESHDLYIGDVGQWNWEEVDVQPATSGGGENYGWSCFEGTHANASTNMPQCLGPEAYTMPVFEYDHSPECSITGGFVYRGERYPALVGHYLLTDYCSGTFWDLTTEDGTYTATTHTNLQAVGYSTFGEGVDGEIYLANLSDGSIYHVVETGVGPLSLSIVAGEGSTASLSWTTSAADCDYMLHHSVTPGDNYTLLQSLPDATTYEHEGSLGDGSDDYYYVSGSCYDAAAAVVSNKVGVFEFSLEPGTEG